MLDDISKSGVFRILAKKPRATPEHIQQLINYFHNCLEEYLDLVREATEIEIQHVDGQYVRIWGPLGCIEMDEGYGIRKHIPSAFPIGDEGGSRVLFFADGNQGHGLYHVGYGNLDLEDAIWIASDLRSFLVDAEGIDSF